MKAVLILILSLSFILTARGQETSMEASNKYEYVIYGEYCGECTNYCAPMFKLINNELLGDFSDDFFKNYDAPDSNRLVFDNKQPLRREQYLKAKEMMDSIPDIIFKSDSKIFGEPDDRDQCGIFFQIKIKDKLKTFYIDTDINAIPIELRNFANRLMDNWYENAHKLK